MVLRSWLTFVRQLTCSGRLLSSGTLYDSNAVFLRTSVPRTLMSSMNMPSTIPW